MMPQDRLHSTALWDKMLRLPPMPMLEKVKITGPRYCQRCSNHGKKNLVRFHKKICEYRDCTTPKCMGTVSRQETMKEQIRLRREKDQEDERLGIKKKKPKFEKLSPQKRDELLTYAVALLKQNEHPVTSLSVSFIYLILKACNADVDLMSRHIMTVSEEIRESPIFSTSMKINEIQESGIFKTSPYGDPYSYSDYMGSLAALGNPSTYFDQVPYVGMPPPAAANLSFFPYHLRPPFLGAKVPSSPDSPPDRPLPYPDKQTESNADIQATAQLRVSAFRDRYLYTNYTGSLGAHGTPTYFGSVPYVGMPPPTAANLSLLPYQLRPPFLGAKVPTCSDSPPDRPSSYPTETGPAHPCKVKIEMVD